MSVSEQVLLLLSVACGGLLGIVLGYLTIGPLQF